MLTVTDMWVTFARHYLDALDRTPVSDGTRRYSSSSGDYACERRTQNLAGWHTMLLARLADTDAEDVLDQLVQHRALGGPEPDFLRARLAHQRRDTTTARTLITAALGRLSGHQDMLDFAVSLEAPLPARAREILKERSFRP